MAIRALVQLRGFIESLQGGSRNINPTDIQNNAPPDYSLQLELANGDTTVPVSATAYGVIIIFDPTSTTVKTIKGVGGDTGIIVAKTRWLVLSFDTIPIVSFIINSTGADTGKKTNIIFF